jgi:hypothetical protein
MGIFKDELPPLQYLHPFNGSDRPDKLFGSWGNYFNVLKECGLWDFENDKMIETPSENIIQELWRYQEQPVKYESNDKR